VTPPVALTLAGSDSGGGAGIQADLRTFAALQVHGATAISAVTAQTTTEVREIFPLPPEMVVAQIEATLADLSVLATKTGMLATAATVIAVGALAAAGRLPQLVVDPVLVATSGGLLLEPGAEAAYLEQLLPAATVVTPNLAEAGALLGAEIRTLADQRDAAQALIKLGVAWAVVTGGHVPPGAANCEDGVADAVDVVSDGNTVTELRAPRWPSPNTHGSGCSFAAAIAAGLARGAPVPDAIRAAKTFVHRAIAGAAAWDLGAGPGPIDHLGWNHQEEP
jgi:hydroxymethylpyrimidine/phosphomethylpyrimidine kinase